MPMINNPVRYAHTDGHTDVCYSEEGKYILTCGNDGDIRVWLGLEDDDPASHCVGENALALAQKGSKLYVGTDDNTLRCYKFPEMERDGVLTRFSKSVTHISVSPDGYTVAAASENGEIYIRDLRNQKFKTLSGHNGPVLAVAIDPKVEYLASSSGDGRVCVWELETATVVHSWKCVAMCSTFFEAKVLCRVSWQTDTGRLLAVPEGSSVALYERDTWQRWHVFSHPALDKEVSISIFSPCGKFLAASSVAGDVAVWNVTDKSCVGLTKQDKRLQICALAWNPNGSGEIAFCDFSGQLGTVVGCVVDRQVYSGIDSDKPDDLADALTNGMMSDDNDEENAISLEKIKSQVAFPLSDDILDSVSAAGECVDDDDAHSERVFASELQPPFQPSATPLHLQHRFMVWNSVGVVCCSSLPEDVIDVEFHDTATHHALHIRNLQRYHIASLTEHALVLASESEDDSPSKVMCVLLDCWDGSREWSVELPACESALCVASGSTWVAVATDARLLRLWTLSGAQREVVALPGPALCLAAHASKLLFACHLGPGVCGDQNVGYAQMCLASGCMSSWQPLPLAPRSTLQWLGYSDQGTPCLHDSSGSVRLLSARGYWLPVLHTSDLVKGKSDHYFLLGISETCQNVRAVLCKGSRYPHTTPRPPVVEIPLKVGLVDVSSDRGQLEELFWRSMLTTPAARQPLQSAKEASIKLFAMACRAEQQARAVELCALMADQQVVQLALKYASKLGKTQVADRIAQLDVTHLRRPAFLDSFSWLEEKIDVPSCGPSPVTCNSYSESRECESTDDSTAHTAERGSLLMEASRTVDEAKETAALAIVSSQTRSNPFKKSAGHLQLGRGLANLSSVPRSSPVARTSATEGPSKQGRLLLQARSNKSNKAGDLPVFVEWYPQQEAILREQYPTLSAQELTKEGLKRYKQLQKKENTPSENGTPEPAPAPATIAEVSDDHGGKRKLVDEEKPPAKKPTSSSSKLTAFLFKKS